MVTEEPVRIARDHLPYPVRLAAAWSACLVLVVAGAWLIGEGISRLSLVVGPVAVAILLAAMLRPLVDRIPARVPRVLAAVVVVLGLVGVVLAAIALVASQLASGIPMMRNQIATGLDRGIHWLEEGPLHITADRLQAALDQSRSWLTQHTDMLASGAVQVGHTAVETVASVLLCLVSLLFFLYQGEKLWMFFVRWMPAAGRQHFDTAFRHGWSSLGAYTRTQLAVAAINAAGVGLGALILRVPFVIPIIVVVFFASFVPIVGTLVGGMVPFVLALVERGPAIALIMLLIVVAVHLTESHVLQPLLMGHAVALHPLAVILVVAGGTYLFGVIGALFAVPITAMANSIVRYLANRDTGPGVVPSLGDLHGPDHPHEHGRDGEDDDDEASAVGPDAGSRADAGSGAGSGANTGAHTGAHTGRAGR